MNLTKTQEILDVLKKELKIEASFIQNLTQPMVLLEAKDLILVCSFLYKNPTYFFDLLNCISAVDNGLEKGTIDLIYHLTSIPYEQSVILKVQIDRSLNENALVDSVSSIWKTADWHEREIFDFFGVKFNLHPDLRRILLPADWVGFPMRKDYEQQETYHGIKVKY